MITASSTPTASRIVSRRSSAIAAGRCVEAPDKAPDEAPDDAPDDAPDEDESGRKRARSRLAFTSSL